MVCMASNTNFCLTYAEFSDEGLAQFISKLKDNASLRVLNLNKILLKSKTRSATMRALADLVANNHSGLNEVTLRDSKLKVDIVPFLQGLSKNHTIRTIDITGNYMGDVGCQYLASSLHYSKVRRLSFVAAS